MHWILQNNIFNEDAYNTLEETLQRFNIPYSVHKVIPFVGDLLPEPNLTTNNAICMGSYSMRHWARKAGVTPGVFDLEPFNFEVQLAHWGEHMLNAGAVVDRFEDARFTEEEMFIRPIEDSKVFAGRVMEREDFRSWQKQVCVLKLDFGSSLHNDTLVQVCPLKKIYSEHRFWIVNGKIATASTYKQGSRVVYIPNPDEVYHEYVRARIAEWQPHVAFVIDVADTDAGIKIVEINTLNSCGFYACDMQKLVMALEDGFNEDGKEEGSTSSDN